jgi:membrane protease YdiL (CAAX protease family)
MHTERQRDRNSGTNWTCAAVSYAAVIAGFWFASRHFAMSQRLGGHFASAFASFALLMAVYWTFGFGAGEWLRRVLRSPRARVLAPGLLVVPYLVFAIPRGDVHTGYCAFFFLLPVGIALLFEATQPAPGAFSWQDAIALAAIGLPVELRWVANAWPGVSSVPKLLLVDAALYAYLVVRRLEGVGYDFRPRWRDLAVGFREWLFFAPIGIGLGLALGFIHFYARLPGPGMAAAAWLITFFFVAIPEELFFRGLLLNLLEPRLGRWKALAVSSVIFGLSHFNKGAPVFNWRYVLLATIAGLFYGRAWLDRRRLFSSATTHTAVDVVWTLWFR